jgi:hypothetical protein
MIASTKSTTAVTPSAAVVTTVRPSILSTQGRMISTSAQSVIAIMKAIGRALKSQGLRSRLSQTETASSVSAASS